jgi:Tol biopolymer transport system component
MMAIRSVSAAADSAGKDGACYFVIKPEGGPQKKISLAESLPQSSIVTLDWSRDGKRIAFDTVTTLNELNLMKNVISKGQK